MRFNDNSFSVRVREAIKNAEKLLSSDSKMIEEIRNKSDFKYDSGGGEWVAWVLLKERPPIDVQTYKPKNPWTKAIGYFDGVSIHINSRKLPYMTIEDITANLCHEYAHYAGFHHGKGWGSNKKTLDKCLYSVPYFISENILKWI